MKLYLDLIFMLNFLFDLLLLLAVGVILRRNASVKRLLLGALVGGASIFFLFIKISSLTLFFLKILVSIMMVMVSFKFRNPKYTLINLFYLYSLSILLGGFLYYLNVEFSYKQDGLIFYHNGLSINWIALMILSPLILYAYIKQILNLKHNYSNYYQVDIYYRSGIKQKCSAFLDTGNKLKDPYQRRPIILIDKHQLKVLYNDEDIILVPYDTLNGHGLLKCVIPEKIHITGVGTYKKVLIGLSNTKIKIDGVDCLLNPQILEGYSD